MENKLKVAQDFVNNSIPNQELSYANQLTVKQWNDIINVLRIQTNNTTNYLRQLHSWLIGVNNEEDYAVIEDGLNLYSWIKRELKGFENYLATVKSSFVSIGDEIQTITGKKTFKHFVSDKILPETKDGMLGDGSNQFSTAHIKEVITDSIVPIIDDTESGVSGNIGKDGLYWNEAFINGINANKITVTSIILDGEDLKAWTKTHVQEKINALWKELYDIDEDGIIDSIREITKALEEGGEYYKAFIDMIDKRALKTDFEKHVSDMNKLFDDHVAEFEGHLESSNKRIEEVNTNIEMHRQNKEWLVDAEGNGAWVHEDNPHEVTMYQMPELMDWERTVESSIESLETNTSLNTQHRLYKGNPHDTGIDDIVGLKEALQEGTKGNELIEAHIKNEVDDNGNILTDGTKNNNPHKVTHEQVIGLANRLNELEENIKAYVKDGTLVVRIKKGDSTATYNFTANQETQTGIEFGIPVKVADLEDAEEYAKKTDIGDGVHTITVNGQPITDNTFRANSPDNITTDIPVPTKLSDLEDDVIGKGNLTIQRNNEELAKFNADSDEDVSVNIQVPTTVEELEDSSEYPRLVNGLIPNKYLPSFVDDVIEFSSKDLFPEPGESGKIYVDTSANTTHRWTGTQYIQVGGADLTEIETRVGILENEVDQLETKHNTDTTNLNNRIDNVSTQISDLETKHDKDIEDLQKDIENINIGEGNLIITQDGVEIKRFNANAKEDVTLEIPDPDLSNFVKKGDNVSSLANDTNYITIAPVEELETKHKEDIQKLIDAINKIIGGEGETLPDEIPDLTPDDLPSGTFTVSFGDNSVVFTDNANISKSINIPKNLSSYTNDAGFITSLPKGTFTVKFGSTSVTFNENTGETETITIPNDLSVFDNSKANFISESDLPSSKLTVYFGTTSKGSFTDNAGTNASITIPDDLTNYNNTTTKFINETYITNNLKDGGNIYEAIESQVTKLRQDLYEVDNDNILDSIMELSAALKNNPEIITVLEESIANKMDKQTSVTTNSIVRFTSDGNSKTSGVTIDDDNYITAAGYKIPNKTSDDILLADGSTISKSEFSGSDLDDKYVTLDETAQTVRGNKTFSGNVVTYNNKFEIKATSVNDDSWIKLSNATDASYYAFGIRRPYATYGLQMKYHPASGSDEYYNIWHSGNDGAGSSLDADLLDGQQGTYYLDYNNFTNTPNATINIVAGKGLITGGSFTLNQTTNTDITINIDSNTLTVNDDSIELTEIHEKETSYGTAQQPTHGSTFAIPSITVDKYGRVSSAKTVNITLPTDLDSDKKTSSSATTSKIYLIGATDKSSEGQTTYTNDGVYATGAGVLGVKQVKVESTTTGSTKSCTMQYDESINAMKFVFV